MAMPNKMRESQIQIDLYESQDSSSNKLYKYNKKELN